MGSLMYLRLDMPYIDRQSERGRLLTWLKQPGDSIAPGEPICDVVIEALKVLEIPRNAKLLTKLTRTKIKTTVREAPLAVAWRVIAREPGSFERRVLDEGDPVEVGDTMALLATGGEQAAGPPDDLADLSAFRASAEWAPEDDFGSGEGDS